jgi:Xaa-Pro dipeptidase
MPSSAEIERRYRNLRKAMASKGLDCLLVCGNQYAGFEGALRYVSGFEIVHRYAYVLLPADDEPTLLFPSEARWIGDKSKPWVKDQVWADAPGTWIRDRVESRGWKRLGVYGLDYIMPVRDYRDLAGGRWELAPFDAEFDMARAVKSDEELDSIYDSMSVIVEGFRKLVEAYQPGRTEAEIMAPAIECFFARGAGARMMNAVLSGSHGEAEAHFKVPGDRVVHPDDLLLYSLEITGADGYWVEFSRPLIQGRLGRHATAVSKIYPEALEAARRLMRDGERASAVHRASAGVFARYGFGLGHLSGHSIGMSIIEHPPIGADEDVELRENMVLSFHPQVLDTDGRACFYSQDTYRVGKTEGYCLAEVPWGIYGR